MSPRSLRRVLTRTRAVAWAKHDWVRERGIERGLRSGQDTVGDGALINVRHVRPPSPAPRRKLCLRCGGRGVRRAGDALVRCEDCRGGGVELRRASEHMVPLSPRRQESA